jgi:hypothetical protein
MVNFQLRSMLVISLIRGSLPVVTIRLCEVRVRCKKEAGISLLLLFEQLPTNSNVTVSYARQ